MESSASGESGEREGSLLRTEAGKRGGEGWSDLQYIAKMCRGPMVYSIYH
jgi:hypothetical protein